MDSKLFLKVSHGEERVGRIKAFLVFAVAALHFTIVSGCIRADQLMLDAQVGGSFLKKGLDILFTVGKTVGKFKAVVGLDTFHSDTSAGIPLHQPFQEIGRGVGGLFRVGRKETEPGELVNCGILKQAQLRVSDAAAGNDFHIHLDYFPRMSHLLVRFWRVSLFLLLLWEHAQFAHDSKQALGPPGIAALFQSMPQFHQTKMRVTAAHIPDQLQLCLCMLVWMAVGPSGLAGQGFRTPIPAGTPEADILPTLVILSAGTADAVFLRILHYGLPVCHILCYTLFHEGCGLLSVQLGVVTQL